MESPWPDFATESPSRRALCLRAPRLRPRCVVSLVKRDLSRLFLPRLSLEDVVDVNSSDASKGKEQTSYFERGANLDQQFQCKTAQYKRV